MQVNALDHVNIITDNLDGTCTFYAELLGLDRRDAPPPLTWAPIDVYADEAGDSETDKSYTTAMCVLCLEVYYRYFTPLLLGR